MIESDVMRPDPAFKPTVRFRPAACGRKLGLAACLAAALLLGGCSGGGIYANIGIGGPSVDLGPVSVQTGVHLGRWL